MQGHNPCFNRNINVYIRSFKPQSHTGLCIRGQTHQPQLYYYCLRVDKQSKQHFKDGRAHQ